MKNWLQVTDSRTVCLSIDVEWAHPEVLADTLQILRERSLLATLFCTHDGVDAGANERGIHPNFRRTGDVAKQCIAQFAQEGRAESETEYYRRVLRGTLSFAPEATGSRSHSLFYDSQLMPIYKELGLRYDSTYFLPLCYGLEPVQKEYGVIEFPIFYNDFYELRTRAVDMDADRIELDRGGLKVFNFHPNLIYTNCPSLEHYEASRPEYHNPEKLLEQRYSGKGARDLFLRLLDRIYEMRLPVMTMGALENAISTAPVRQKSHAEPHP